MDTLLTVATGTSCTFVGGCCNRCRGVCRCLVRQGYKLLLGGGVVGSNNLLFLVIRSGILLRMVIIVQCSSVVYFGITSLSYSGT